jgi:hypothetical protein
MTKNVLEKTVFVFATVVLVAAGWFWIRQIESVRALLEMAYG